MAAIIRRNKKKEMLHITHKNKFSIGSLFPSVLSTFAVRKRLIPVIPPTSLFPIVRTTLFFSK